MRTTEQTRVKYELMRKIKERLKDSPMDLAGIRTFIKSRSIKLGDRTILRYLGELKLLGDIDYDEATGFYQMEGTRRQVWSNTAEYEIALKHSKYLVFSDKHRQRLDGTSPDLMIDLLAFGSDDKDNQCLVQHFKTGYLNEVYLPMEEYKSIIRKKKLYKGSRPIQIAPLTEMLTRKDFERTAFLPMLDGGEQDEMEDAAVRSLENEASPFDLVSIAATRDFKKRNLKKTVELPIDVISESCKDWKRPSLEVTKELTRLLELRDMLVGRIYQIVYTVQNGTPLYGSCDCCPRENVTIKLE